MINQNQMQQEYQKEMYENQMTQEQLENNNQNVIDEISSPIDAGLMKKNRLIKAQNA